MTAIEREAQTVSFFIAQKGAKDETYRRTNESTNCYPYYSACTLLRLHGVYRSRRDRHYRMGVSNASRFSTVWRCNISFYQRLADGR